MPRLGSSHGTNPDPEDTDIAISGRYKILANFLAYRYRIGARSIPMSKVITVRANLFDKDPNAIGYKGRRGMNVSVHRNGVIDEVFEWETKSFNLDDQLNAAISYLKIESYVSQGWQRVSDSQIGHWKLVEKGGLRFTNDGCTVKVFGETKVKPTNGKLSMR